TRRKSEQIGRHVKTIRPDAKLRICVEKISEMERIEIPSTRYRITTLRNRNTLISTWRIHDTSAIELKRIVGDDPTIFERVVQDHRLAHVVRIADIAELPLAHEGIETKDG